MNRSLRTVLPIFNGIFCILISVGFTTPKQKVFKPSTSFSYASDCINSVAETDLSVNKIRARLQIAGDLWWDGDRGRYIAPKVNSSGQEVTSFYAASVWMGGKDPSGNLKLAAQTYGRASLQTDYFPGLLEPSSGMTDLETCTNWDRFFRVRKKDIETHLHLFYKSQDGELIYTPEMIPQSLKGWPAFGNPYFASLHDFELPTNGQGLADFVDINSDGIYNPLDGDFPAISYNSCELDKLQEIPDEFIFWIFNDNGNNHEETNADPLGMEVQVTAFAFSTHELLDYSTFYKYKFLYRGTEDLTDMYFGFWVDADLGCYTDDYIGCDSIRNLAFVYNQDMIDGQDMCLCPGGNSTYCEDVPIAGIDLLDSPLGMTSFTYYGNPALNAPPSISDPGAEREFYNYLSGKWRDGEPLRVGGTGFGGNGRRTNYAFHSPPNCNSADCWSMCSEQMDGIDPRFVMSSGPLTLQPNAINEMAIGAMWSKDVEYPCPDLSKFFEHDDLIQAAFDNCFDIALTGPDAPDLKLIGGEGVISGMLSNVPFSNNFNESYHKVDIYAPVNLPLQDRQYTFEGYKVFQVAHGSVQPANLEDFSQARLIFQTDIENGIATIHNWTLDESMNPPVWISEEKVKSNQPDVGNLEHGFTITEDAFTGNELIAGKRYYYIAVAYAYNNWMTFDPNTGEGQQSPYLQGTNNIRIASAIPKPAIPQQFYGTSVPVTRIDGIGAGSQFIDMTQETREKIMDGSFDGRIIYKPGRAPIEVRIRGEVNDLGREFELTFEDEDMSNQILDSNVTWKLTDLNNPTNFWTSDYPVNFLNDQFIEDIGISIALKNGLQPGNNLNGLGDASNGSIGAEYAYEDASGVKWLSGIPDSEGVFDYVSTETNDYDLDPTGALSHIYPGHFTPYYFLDFTTRDEPYISPVWRNLGQLVRNSIDVDSLNNVDIIFTSDKSKWSRCAIIESTQSQIIQAGFETEGSIFNFKLRAATSVGKEDLDGNGLPDPDATGTNGMGWFPGYAIDVETGQRLNIFFGESSIYRCDEPTVQRLGLCVDGKLGSVPPNGADMMWNPSPDRYIPIINPDDEGLWQYISGGSHFIYVLNTPYDSCQQLRMELLNTNPLVLARALDDITWAGFPLLAENTSLLSYADGLIPNDLIVKLRVDNPFEVYTGTGEKNGYPTYIFSLKDFTTKVEEPESQPDLLNDILIVPNPYCCLSANGKGSGGSVRVINLPDESTVTVFDVHGRLVKRWQPQEVVLNTLEWNLQNEGGTAVGTGIYFFRIDVPGAGSKVLKWVGMSR